MVRVGVKARIRALVIGASMEVMWLFLSSEGIGHYNQDKAGVGRRRMPKIFIMLFI